MNHDRVPDDAAAAAAARFRVLVVEDSFHAAALLCDVLSALDVEIVGPKSSVKQALAELSHPEVDAAVLDVNLGDMSVQPVADRLRSLGIPFIFVSGYDSPKLLSREYHSYVFLSKPVEPELVRRELFRLRSVVKCPVTRSRNFENS